MSILISFQLAAVSISCLQFSILRSLLFLSAASPVSTMLVMKPMSVYIDLRLSIRLYSVHTEMRISDITSFLVRATIVGGFREHTPEKRMFVRSLNGRDSSILYTSKSGRRAMREGRSGKALWEHRLVSGDQMIVTRLHLSFLFPSLFHLFS